MSKKSPQTMGQQFGRRSWAEPWTIKMVEPIDMSTESDRIEYLEEAHHNTFLLDSDKVIMET